MDSRDPRHSRTLTSMDLVRTYDQGVRKNEAECVREGCPLHFGPSKVVTFDQTVEKSKELRWIPETPDMRGH